MSSISNAEVNMVTMPKIGFAPKKKFTTIELTVKLHSLPNEHGINQTQRMNEPLSLNGLSGSVNFRSCCEAQTPAAAFNLTTGSAHAASLFFTRFTRLLTSYRCINAGSNGFSRSHTV
jgi:hypothetical protein